MFYHGEPIVGDGIFEFPHGHMHFLLSADDFDPEKSQWGDWEDEMKSVPNVSFYYIYQFETDEGHTFVSDIPPKKAIRYRRLIRPNVCYVEYSVFGNEYAVRVEVDGPVTLIDFSGHYDIVDFLRFRQGFGSRLPSKVK